MEVGEEEVIQKESQPFTMPIYQIYFSEIFYHLNIDALVTNELSNYVSFITLCYDFNATL